MKTEKNQTEDGSAESVKNPFQALPAGKIFRDVFGGRRQSVLDDPEADPKKILENLLRDTEKLVFLDLATVLSAVQEDARKLAVVIAELYRREENEELLPFGRVLPEEIVGAAVDIFAEELGAAPWAEDCPEPWELLFADPEDVYRNPVPHPGVIFKVKIPQGLWSGEGYPGSLAIDANRILRSDKSAKDAKLPRPPISTVEVRRMNFEKVRACLALDLLFFFWEQAPGDKEEDFRAEERPLRYGEDGRLYITDPESLINLSALAHRSRRIFDVYLAEAFRLQEDEGRETFACCFHEYALEVCAIDEDWIEVDKDRTAASAAEIGTDIVKDALASFKSLLIEAWTVANAYLQLERIRAETDPKLIFPEELIRFFPDHGFEYFDDRERMKEQLRGKREQEEIIQVQKIRASVASFMEDLEEIGALDRFKNLQLVQARDLERMISSLLSREELEILLLRKVIDLSKGFQAFSNFKDLWRVAYLFAVEGFPCNSKTTPDRDLRMKELWEEFLLDKYDQNRGEGERLIEARELIGSLDLKGLFHFQLVIADRVGSIMETLPGFTCDEL